MYVSFYLTNFRPLGCGNHTCELQCHQGECPPCPFLPSTVSYCPCGATPISKLLPEGVVRTSCLDDIPTCDNVCSRPLPCFEYSEGTLLLSLNLKLLLCRFQPLVFQSLPHRSMSTLYFDLYCFV